MREHTIRNFLGNGIMQMHRTVDFDKSPLKSILQMLFFDDHSPAFVFWEPALPRVPLYTHEFSFKSPVPPPSFRRFPNRLPNQSPTSPHPSPTQPTFAISPIMPPLSLGIPHFFQQTPRPSLSPFPPVISPLRTARGPAEMLALLRRNQMQQRAEMRQNWSPRQNCRGTLRSCHVFLGQWWIQW